MNHIARVLASIHAQSFPCEHAWSEQSFAELLDKPGVKLYQQAEQAFLLGRSAADETEILTIAVLPDARRQGIAKGLMQQALVDVSGSCFLEVDAQNAPAISLYEGLGFSVTSTRKDYYKTKNGRSDALLMRYRSAT